VRRGPEPARVEHENRELANAIAAWDEAVAAAARDRACYHADIVAAMKRVNWDSSLVEASNTVGGRTRCSISGVHNGKCASGSRASMTYSMMAPTPLAASSRRVVMRKYFAYLVTV
jgi:hypothetical protein